MSLKLSESRDSIHKRRIGYTKLQSKSTLNKSKDRQEVGRQEVGRQEFVGKSAEPERQILKVSRYTESQSCLSTSEQHGRFLTDEYANIHSVNVI